jgi:hypothetical protein
MLKGIGPVRFSYGRRITLDLSHRRLLGGLVAATLFGAFACGSNVTTGTGKLPDGASGAAGSTQSTDCAAGDTRQCVGPGACRGGQTCGTDAHWSQCDCGTPNSGGESSGGAAASGGTGAAASSGQSVGGLADIGGAAADAGAGNYAGAGNLNSGDELCPSAPIAVDCSGQCGEKSEGCDKACYGEVKLTSLSPGTVLTRTPSHVGTNPSYAVSNCQCTEPGATPFAYAFHLNFPMSTTASHVLVPTPWHVFSAVPVDRCAPPTVLVLQCADVNRGGLAVWTADPDAPAINLQIEPGPCP